jgi:steroid 5-alpha reductase family enzyme
MSAALKYRNPKEGFMTGLTVSLWVLAGACFVTWLLSVITKDTSWVDRIWSIIPVAYLWIFAASVNFSDARVNVMAVLVTLWGARLTFNFARKGGYQPGGEDYRWEILRQRMTPAQYQVFNIFFIVIFQNIVLWLITLPAWTTTLHPGAFDGWDVLLTVLFLALLTLETVADQQQWNFHQRKKAAIAAGKKPAANFLTTGLFSVSRHPNFFAEQSQWWVIFLFGAAAAGSLLEWTVVGAFLLSALFVGSLRFTENISLSKYPEYADYQRRVSPAIPWFPRA